MEENDVINFWDLFLGDTFEPKKRNIHDSTAISSINNASINLNLDLHIHLDQTQPHTAVPDQSLYCDYMKNDIPEMNMNMKLASKKEAGQHSAEKNTSMTKGLPKHTSTTQFTSSNRKSPLKDNKIRDREYYNAAMRKTRRKRKQQRDYLIARNKELEKEQEYFRIEVDRLQKTIEELKACKHYEKSSLPGYIEFENQLLKVEVKRHRSFVNHLNNLMQCKNDKSIRVTNGERSQMAINGIESGIGQILGLFHTSASAYEADKWHCMMYKSEHYASSEVCMRWQFLPLGSTIETAERIVIRDDVYNVPRAQMKAIREMLIGNDTQYERLSRNLLLSEYGPKATKYTSIEELDDTFGNLNLNDRAFSNKNAVSKNEESRHELKLEPLKVVMNKFVKNKDEEKDNDPASVHSNDEAADNVDYLSMRTHVEKEVHNSAFPTLAEARVHVEVYKKKMQRYNASMKPSVQDISRPLLSRKTIVVHTQAPSCLNQDLTSKEGLDSCPDISLSGYVFHEKEDIISSVTSFPLIEKVPYIHVKLGGADWYREIEQHISSANEEYAKFHNIPVPVIIKMKMRLKLMSMLRHL